MSKFFFVILTVYFSFSLMAGQEEKFKIESESQKSIYESFVECQSSLLIGSFQNCSLKIFHKEKLVINANISLNGGMLAHGHGLPTSPKVLWSEDQGAYLIKGLKFSMPGQWSLNFKVNASEGILKDQIDMVVEVN